MSTRYGVVIPLPESLIAEVGEEAAWDLARQVADRKAHRYSPTARRTDEQAYPENFPQTNPDTGEELPPMRAYRFTYTDDGDEQTPDGYLDRRPA